MRIQLAVLLFSSLSLVAACGGDDDGDNGGDTADASPTADADTESPDASGEADAGDTGGSAAAIGQECAVGQGDCPDGLECINFGGANPVCVLSCPEQNQASDVGCEGYEGPGVARCILGVDSDGDQNPDFMACAIICEDADGLVCDEGDVCNSTCPHDLTCSQDLGSGVKSCQY